MSKKDYINAVNEINVNETLKQETLKKATNTKKNSKYRYNKIYPIASLAFMCAIIMAIVLPNKSMAPINEVTDEQTKISQELPKVENFKNLYAMLKARDTKRYYIDDMLSVDSITNANSKNETATNEVANDYSKTNTQVQGVDEADIVKTDGTYIYYLTNEKLTIINTENASQMKEMSTIKFDETFTPEEIFLNNDKIIVIGKRYEYDKTERKIGIDEDFLYPNYMDKTYTSAKLYNVKDKTNPTLERTVEVEGDYLTARMIGSNVYIASNKYMYYAYICNTYKSTELNEDDFKPHYLDTATSNETKSINFDCIYYIPEFEDTNYLNIVAFNITNNQEANVESYLGAGEEIYASKENLYVTKTKYDYERKNKTSITTEIYKFNLNNANCTFAKAGDVPGSVLNQFSMDECNGYFRIATTDSTSWNSESNTNNLYVLNENLETIGKIEGLAKGERIYSVRFMGNRAYMVTFVETDPLFVIDLSNPTTPTVLGELKIPGYSKYLHPYDETHLIGIGEDTEVVNYGYGDRVVTNGMKMAMFDVTDPNNPQELYNVKIGEKGTYSELLYNHKALLFSKEKNIIAFPISITDNDYKVTFQGAIVYGVSLEKGFELKTKISNSATDYDRYYSRNRVERIIYIKDTLFTLSNGLIKAVDLNTFETKGSIELN
jgi:inhibitor of cysteine peptidase